MALLGPGDLPFPGLMAGGVLAVSVVGVMMRRLALEWAAMLLALAAVLAGWLSPAEAMRGFANPATITVAAMFVISTALERTGGLAPIEQLLDRFPLGRTWQQLLCLAVVVGPLSAVISNTAVVAMFIPVVERWARRLSIAPSQFLMPLSFITVLAGVGTLLGTSSNLVASVISEQLGYGSFGLLQFTPLAIGVYVPGVILLSVLAPMLLPRTDPVSPAALTSDYGLDGYLSELCVPAGSSLVGKSLESTLLQHNFDVRVLALIRHGNWFSLPLDDREIEADDLLIVRTSPQQLLALRETEGLELVPERLSHKLVPSERDVPRMNLVEVLIPPDSILIGQTVMELRFAQRFNAVVLAIRRGRELLRHRLGQVKFKLGDALLIETPQAMLRGLRLNRDLLLVETAEIPEDRRARLPWAVGLSGAALILSAWHSDWLVVWALLAVVGFVFTGVLSNQEVYAAIRWDVVVLLAALLPLSSVLQTMGMERWLLQRLVSYSQLWSPYALLVALYVTTALLTELISNQAAVAFVLPLGLGLTQGSGVNPMAAIAVMTFAASHSFLTPIGYQTNAMVYAVGHYRLMDFLRLGLPLTCCLAVLTPALAIHFYP